MKIYIIGGKSGSGKSEVAKMIKEYYQSKCLITGFSKYLKVYAKELTNWDGNPDDKPRDFLQSIGQMIRDIDKSFLINRLVEDIKIYEKLADVVVIDDARMPEEFEVLKNTFNDVTSIYMVNEFSVSKLSDTQQKDITETALDNYANFDYIIENKDLIKTKEEVLKILEEGIYEY